ncbi:hypothetical protein F4802DRAFT_217686 [Xylaria palmicola]|nr:hypothetical protein F4802DRAFT_217686 [Xylaria palmicola]
MPILFLLSRHSGVLTVFQPAAGVSGTWTSTHAEGAFSSSCPILYGVSTHTGTLAIWVGNVQAGYLIKRPEWLDMVVRLDAKSRDNCMTLTRTFVYLAVHKQLVSS